MHTLPRRDYSQLVKASIHYAPHMVNEIVFCPERYTSRDISHTVADGLWNCRFQPEFLIAFSWIKTMLVVFTDQEVIQDLFLRELLTFDLACIRELPIWRHITLLR